MLHIGTVLGRVANSASCWQAASYWSGLGTTTLPISPPRIGPITDHDKSKSEHKM